MCQSKFKNNKAPKFCVWHSRESERSAFLQLIHNWITKCKALSILKFWSKDQRKRQKVHPPKLLDHVEGFRVVHYFHTWSPGSWWWGRCAGGFELQDKQSPYHLAKYLDFRSRFLSKVSLSILPVRRLGVSPWNIPEMTSASFGPQVTIPRSKHMANLKWTANSLSGFLKHYFR